MAECEGGKEGDNSTMRTKLNTSIKRLLFERANFYGGSHVKLMSKQIEGFLRSNFCLAFDANLRAGIPVCVCEGARPEK